VKYAHGLQASPAGILRSLGRTATALGEYQEAEHYLRKSLELGLREGDAPALPATLLVLAESAAKQGHFHQACRWSSLARHHPAAEESVREETRQLLKDLRGKLASEALQAACEAGKGAVLEKVVRELAHDVSLSTR